MSRIIGSKRDEAEFLEIAKQRIRKDLGRYIIRSRFVVGRDGKSLVAIPISEIELPTLRFGFPEEFAIGQGDGDKGKDLGPIPSDEDGEGKGAGSGSGSKIIVEVDETEFFAWLGEYLKLPRIKPKGDRTIFQDKERFTTIHRLGPKSSLHLKRTFREAIKRSVASGTFTPPEKTEVSIAPPDMRFVSSKVVREPKDNAVLVFMRDISGSLGQEEAEAISRLCDYCEKWLKASYGTGAFETVYIVHDGEAQEVTKGQFLSTNSYGGTVASTAHELCLKIFDERYPTTSWNQYVFYFSDGFNYGSDDDVLVEIMEQKILPAVNQYNYGQVEVRRDWLDAYEDSGAETFSMPGTIGHLFEEKFKAVENIAFASINGQDEDSVIEAIREFFKKGN